MRMVSIGRVGLALMLAAVTTVAPARLAAQASDPAPNVPPRTIIAINPFLPLAGYFQAELETKLRDNLAVAVSGSHTKLDDSYTSVDTKLRLYPQEKGLEGFAIAAGLGYGRISDVSSYYCPELGPCTETRRAASGPTFSVETHYQWLLGRSRHTAVAIGGGVKRYYVDDQPQGFEVFTEYVPTLRLTIGYAFR